MNDRFVLELLKYWIIGMRKKNKIITKDCAYHRAKILLFTG